MSSEPKQILVCTNCGAEHEKDVLVIESLPSKARLSLKNEPLKQCECGTNDWRIKE